MAAPGEMSGAKRRLLEKYLRGEVARQNWELPIEPRPPGATIPLAPDQHLIWLSSQMIASEPVYNEPVTLHYRGTLNRDALERSFNEIVRRHEILRTTFASVGGEVVQAVHDHLTIQIPFLDLSKLVEKAREEEAGRAATADARRLFDLSVGPLFRARLVKMQAEYYRLYVTLHHIIFDGASVYQVLLPELEVIYGAFAAGEASPLEEPRTQYADFALWQKRMLDNDSVAPQTAYWRTQLAGELPDLQLPADRPRPAVQSYRGAMKIFALPAGMTAALKAASRAEGVTMYMLLLATFKSLLYRYSGQEDILVGGPSDARRRAEFRNVMGHCVNLLSFRTRPSASMTFRQYLAEVKDTVLAALANGEVPLDQLIRDLRPKRESARRPFFQVIFSMEPPSDPLQVGSPWRLTHTDTDTGFAKLDLYLEVDERREGLTARFVYSTDIFDAATIDRMTGHWLTLLQSVIDTPGAKLFDLAMLTPSEESELRAANQTAREIPYVAVHELFERQAAKTPDSIAVEAAGVKLTYRQLNERANRLARRLRRAGVKRGTLVAVCVERTIELAVAPLAVLKAGGAYLPLDPSFPPERLAYLVEDAEAPVLLTLRSLEKRLPSTGAQTIFYDEADPSAAALDAGIAPGDLAYVRYTSGSTGRPKGVEISHRALVNLLLSMQREPGFTASDSLLAVTTFSFDISELELFLPLISGGRVVIAARADARDPRRLMERLIASKCNVLQSTPAAWRALIDAGWRGQQNLRALCGGEALPRDLAEQLLPRVAELWNLYGPTETTVWSAVHRVRPGVGPVPIGYPIDNTEIYILDARRKPAPIGVAGELYIGGAGVARGYLRREDLTQERFVESPFQTNQRLYRTGDLARRLADGTLECLGRIDNQIKIRGFRIEPGEIEAALLDCPDVRAAAVRVWPDASGNLSMAAYVSGAVEIAGLRRFLEQRLPDYMIPARFAVLDRLPLTPNGKVDRNALPEPSDAEKTEHYLAPRNEGQRRLAAIWESVLDARPIGIEDNFFDLGGHSFLVAKLLRKIEVEFGARLSMAAVFEAPTIARLEEVLRDASSIARMPRTINLQPVGSREPLFWIHGGPLFRPLATRLGTNRPFLGVDFDYSDEGKSANSTIPQLAARLVEPIRAVQPHGPYYLGGWCISGLLAYEVASQLIDAGESVVLVVLLDTLNPVHYLTISKLRLLASKAAYHLKRVPQMELRHVLPYLRKRLQGLFSEVSGTGQAVATPFDLALNLAAVAYHPKPLPTRVLAVQPAERPAVRDLHASWAQLSKVANIEVRDVPGDHLSVLVEPHVASLARTINQRLRDNIVEIRRAAAG